MSPGITDAQETAMDPQTPDDDVVMSFKDWCRRNDISPATGRRLIGRGDGPDLIKLSANRIGITYGADRAWKAQRRIGAAA
jgi:hypothetical protein